MASADPEMIKVVEALPSEEELEAKCLELGLIMRRAPRFDVTHPAVTLFPSAMKASVLQELYRRQPLWNEAIDRTSRNFSFLCDALRETAASDAAFTGRLLEMMQRVYLQAPVLPERAREGREKGDAASAAHVDKPVYQPLMLGIFRTDYMRSMDGLTAASNAPGQPRPEETVEQWKNVEFNTVSCSFAGLSPLVNQFHTYLDSYRRARLTEEAEVAAAAAADGPIELSVSGSEVPAALAGAAAAWRHAVPFHEFVADYRRRSTVKLSGADTDTDTDAIPVLPIVLVVTQEGERNTGDQYKLLLTLLERHGIISIRRTMAQLHESMELVYFDGKDRSAQPPFAVVEKKYVVSVVYFRSTYVPGDFPTEACWRCREDLERCNGVKCPSLPHHLLTFKKLQQVLSSVSSTLVPIALKGNSEKAKLLSAHFMDQFSLNVAEYTKEEVEAGRDPEYYIREAIANPGEYVLKPQLEGGGNLIAGLEMVELLKANSHAGDPHYAKIRKEYILMRKIHVEKKDALLFRNGSTFLFVKSACSEVGIYGCILSDGSEISYTSTEPAGEGRVTGKLFNRCGGYSVRTKPADVEDGGVMAGVACLDNLRLLSYASGV